jgi:uncharacterized membrane protein
MYSWRKTFMCDTGERSVGCQHESQQEIYFLFLVVWFGLLLGAVQSALSPALFKLGNDALAGSPEIVNELKSDIFKISETAVTHTRIAHIQHLPQP